jgi:hypothetical protein
MVAVKRLTLVRYVARAAVYEGAGNPAFVRIRRKVVSTCEIRPYAGTRPNERCRELRRR